MERLDTYTDFGTTRELAVIASIRIVVCMTRKIFVDALLFRLLSD